MCTSGERDNTEVLQADLRVYIRDQDLSLIRAASSGFENRSKSTRVSKYPMNFCWSWQLYRSKFDRVLHISPLSFSLPPQHEGICNVSEASIVSCVKLSTNNRAIRLPSRLGKHKLSWNIILNLQQS